MCRLKKYGIAQRLQKTAGRGGELCTSGITTAPEARAPPCVPEEMALTSCRRSCNCKFPTASGMGVRKTRRLTPTRLMAPALRAHGGPQAAVAGVVNAEAQASATRSAVARAPSP